MKENSVVKDLSREMQEKTSKGTVKGSLLLQYIQSGMNVFEIIFLLTLMSVAQGAATLNDWFISLWTNIEESKNTNNITIRVGQEDEPFYMSWTSNTCLIVYGAILGFCLVTTVSRSLLFYKFIMACAESLHAMIYNGVTSTYMRFFDKNPSGRILNRFSKDIGTVDESLPMMLFNSSRVRFSIIF